MAEHELPSNSNKSKGQGPFVPIPPRVTEYSTTPTVTIEEKPAPVVVGKRMVVKESAFKKFIFMFLADDIDDIGRYLKEDLIIPSVKGIICNFVEAAFAGKRVSGIGSSPITSNDPLKYHRVGMAGKAQMLQLGNKQTQPEPPNEFKRMARDLDIDKGLLFASKKEATDCLVSMIGQIKMYGFVSVGYLLDIIEETNPTTWDNLDSAVMKQQNGGWLLLLPPMKRNG